MTKLLIYFLIYVVLVSLVGAFMGDVSIQGVDLNIHNMLVCSLVIPFLILIQGFYEVLFSEDIKTQQSIVLKVIGLLIGLGTTFGILFLLVKLSTPYILSTTLLLWITGILSMATLLYIPRFRNSLAFFISNISILLTFLITNIKAVLTYSSILIIFGLILYHKVIIRWLLLPKHTIIQSNPVYLNQETTVGSNENMNVKTIVERTRSIEANYNFSVSFSLYLNAQNIGGDIAYNKNTTLLDYGGNPTIRLNSIKKQFIFSFNLDNTTTKNIIIPYNDINGFKLSHQRWNTVVVSMKGGSFDLFINGSLIHHDQITPNYTINSIKIGEKNGIGGGVKNIVFYNQPLALYQIHLLDSL